MKIVFCIKVEPEGSPTTANTSTSMEQPQETGNDALWTEVAEATFARAEESPSQLAKEFYLIRHTRSKDYFSYGHWTFDESEAQAFRSSDIAMSVLKQCGLCNAELVRQSVTASSGFGSGANGRY